MISEGSGQQQQPILIYRSIQPSDKQRLKELHEEFFPVKYSDSFYDDIIQGKGVFGGKLFSIIVEEEKDGGNKEIVAFVLAQMLAYPSQCDDNDLFPSSFFSSSFPSSSTFSFSPLTSSSSSSSSSSSTTPKEVFYILTIGVITSHRQLGIASTLITRCISYASSFSSSSSSSPHSCGAVYLHVIDYNTSAMALYKKCGFICLKRNKDFYLIDGRYYDADVYLFYLHQSHANSTPPSPPLHQRVLRRIR